MPSERTIVKAEIREVTLAKPGEESTLKDKTVTVQFNPETLKVSYANQQSGNDQKGGSGTQFVGRGSTKLSLDLIFDVTVPMANGDTVDDVRALTKDIAYFITPIAQGDKFLPPGVRITWGSFFFEGVMDSMNETLDFFSAEGKPLRATVSIALSKQEIQFKFNQEPNRTPGTQTPGTTPQQPARSGDSVQSMAGRAGKANDWKNIAAANGIENPRMLAAGTLINLNAKLDVKTGASLGISVGVSASASASVTAGFSAGVSAGASASAGAAGSVSAGVSTGASIRIR